MCVGLFTDESRNFKISRRNDKSFSEVCCDRWVIFRNTTVYVPLA